MPSVQIKNVPDDVHAVLRRRAADARQSLQEYLLATLTEQARRVTPQEWAARVRSRERADISVDEIVAQVRADRDSH